MITNETIKVIPVTFTDLTCEQVTGMKWRLCRRFLQDNKVPVARAGRRVLIRVDRFLEAVDRASGIGRIPEPWDEEAMLRRAVGIDPPLPKRCRKQP